MPDTSAHGNGLARAHARATRVHLVRHGTTLLNRQNRYRGRRDVALDQGGWEGLTSGEAGERDPDLFSAYQT